MERRFKFDPWSELEKIRSTGATPATDASICEKEADVATVATIPVPIRDVAAQCVADVATKAEKLKTETRRAPVRKLDTERPAIIEFDGGIPRLWAEGYARLLEQEPPEKVTQERWELFLDDCGQFLDHWAAKAEALGWGAHDLFGIGPSYPIGAVHLAGLLWLLQGAYLLALTKDTGTVRLPSGTIQTYYRSQPGSGQRLAWEIRSESK